MRLQREDRERQAAEQRRKESSEFVTALTTHAAAVLGEEVGAAWVRDAVGAATELPFDEGRFALDRQPRERTGETMGRERDRVLAVREVEWRRLAKKAEIAAEAAGCRAQLQAETLARFPGQPDRTQMWLRGRQHSLGRSPWDHCADERTLGDCARLFHASLHRGRRR